MKRSLLLHKNNTSQEPNTFIGGIGSMVTSASDLASKTSLSVGDISLFNVDANNNVSCKIDINYTINNSPFGGLVTYYIDLNGRCTSIGDSALKSLVNKVVVLPSLTSCTTQGFAGGGSGTRANYDIISLPILNPIGSTVGYNMNFQYSNITNLYVNNANATNNGGSPDGDLTDVNATIANLNYSTNTTSPDAIDDLSVSDYGGASIHVEWTAPTSTNAVDFYLVFVNNAYVGFTQLTTYTVTLLDFNTSYDIRVVALDEMGNISPFSNTVSQTTLSDYDIPTGDIVSYWNFDSNSNDQVGSNNGTDTSVSYVASGGIGNVADFTAGNTSAITIPDAADLSFGNGTTDNDFTFLTRVKFVSVNNGAMFSKRTAAATDLEYIFSYSTTLGWICRLTDYSTGGNRDIRASLVPTLNQWYEAGIVYKSGVGTIFLNGLAQQTTNTDTGTYVAMENGTGTLSFGKYQNSSAISLDGYLDEPVIFNTAISNAQMADIFAKHQAGQYLTE